MAASRAGGETEPGATAGRELHPAGTLPPPVSEEALALAREAASAREALAVQPEAGALGTRPANAQALRGDLANHAPAAQSEGAGAPLAPGEEISPARPSAEDLLAALEAQAGGAERTPSIYEPENTSVRVVLRARGESWIRITSADGDYLETHTLRPGDTFLVPNRPDLELWTGNAGGLEVIVDGERLAPLGPDGRVMRDVLLDPQRLRARPGAGG